MAITSVNDVVNNNYSTVNVTKTEDSSSDFSKILTDALEQDLTNETLVINGTPGQDDYGGISVNSQSSVLDLINKASATSDSNTSEIAMMMVMSMMQSSGMGGSSDGNSSLKADMTPMLLALAAIFKKLSNDDASTVRENVMLSDNDPVIKDEIDEKVFGNEREPEAEIEQVLQTGEAVIPSEAWRPTTPAITSDESNRSANNLRTVIDQFDVENSERYRPYRNGRDTYCNIFLWDVTSALGCEIPHFVDSGTGNPRTYPDISGAVELDANGVHDWLINSGSSNGWKEVTAGEAQEYANSGKPAVTAYKNPGGIGHVQVVCPSENGGYDPIRGVTVAQAGSSLYNYTNITSVFSSSKLSSIKYFVHE